MKLNEMSGADLRETLITLSCELGAAAYRRRNPGCDPDEAWAFGVAHRAKYRAEALDLLAVLLIDAEGGK